MDTVEIEELEISIEGRPLLLVVADRNLASDEASKLFESGADVLAVSDQDRAALQENLQLPLVNVAEIEIQDSKARFRGLEGFACDPAWDLEALVAYLTKNLLAVVPVIVCSKSQIRTCRRLIDFMSALNNYSK